MTILTILNTVMTFGILVGVWCSVLKPNAGLKDVLANLRDFLGRIADKD